MLRSLPCERGESPLTGTVTAVVLDIVESTKLHVQLGDVALHQSITHWQSALGALADAHGGHLVSRQGDGWLAVFGGARRALRFANEVRTASGFPRLRLGVNTGDALWDGEDYTGLAITLAFRICATAEPGEILVAARSADLVGGAPRFAFGPDRTIEAKGFPDLERVFELLHADSEYEPGCPARVSSAPAEMPSS